ncbi:YaiO family outer membrane beta-barrel protein [Pseudoxanthomonas sp. UTMC 1351]|uniref:YaiO family outer membrane beta-barrel protein n=1 Tax=Pseudoxanthomonas sp. UTMC 1351 TaxID=2695853 RepID=UPI0034CE9939
MIKLQDIDVRTLSSCAIATLVFACSATAAQAGFDKATASVEHVDYSNGHGHRNVLNVETVGSFDATTLVLGAAGGKRDYGNDVEFSGSRFQGTAYHDWNPKLSTRTAVTLSTDDPVFVNREAVHDFNLKVIPNTVLTVGGRYSKYHGDVSVTGLSAGATYYLDRLSASYRYTGYRRSSGTNSHGNVVSLRLKDNSGTGSTQLWLGKGTSVHEYDWMDELQDGKLRSATFRRVQPLTQKWALDASVGKVWYETPATKFDGVAAKVGVTLNW